MKIIIELDQYELNTLKNVLGDEIERNCNDYPDINEACQNILNQLPKITINAETEVIS